ncbi:RloB family protein [Corynebacterium gerontici]|uniref:DUF4276 domain-containing protein n=1 Tax=Corynebacterium gerontici TaxID=2079234 RepID=A0A3G6IYY7_9CORY|nr:RloB family protein [Corynebacterium gerontici]AZA11001.1 hypothetical protein CGERO_03410 [Corynebacterium gerontici]
MGKLRRSRRVREERFTVLLLCQGVRTEHDYFRRLVSDKRIPGVRVQSDPLDPARLVHKAIQLNRDETYDAVFVIVDKDEFLPENLREARRKCEAASKPASKKGVGGVQYRLVVTIPCFEAWLTAHVEEVRSPYTVQQVQRKAAELRLVDARKKKYLAEDFPLHNWQIARRNLPEVSYGQFDLSAGTSVGHLVWYLQEVVHSNLDNRAKVEKIDENGSGAPRPK